jgi:hypothetical protein
MTVSERITDDIRRVIGGLRYDTSTAECLGETSRGGSWSDFNYWEAGLFRTRRTRRYFVAGAGAANSRYAEPVGDGTYGSGRRINPLTEAEALAWAEEYLTTDEIEDAGFPVEDA